MSGNAPTPLIKPKTPLRKDELEKIAKQLKKKLSKASITAKQSMSPTNINSNLSSNPSSVTKTSPLKYYMLKNKFMNSPNSNLSSSPNMYSPNGKSPTQTKTSAAMFLSSSPLKSAPLSVNRDDSPTKKGQPNTPPTALATALKPSPALTISNKSTPAKKEDDQQQPQQTTPTLSRKQLHSHSNNPLLRTPTNSRQNSSGGGNYNDEEGADLLMYLATSPSPAKPYYSSNTPRIKESAKPNNVFVAPPPLTPKRHNNTSLTRTPQNRLTPSVNLFNNGATGLPSSGLTLTPAGFNMSDYVFFTPSPGSAMNQHHHHPNGGSSLGVFNNKNFLKTPDFHSMITNTPGQNGKSSNQNEQTVNGKMINFDKDGLFNNNNDASKD